MPDFDVSQGAYLVNISSNNPSFQQNTANRYYLNDESYPLQLYSYVVDFPDNTSIRLTDFSQAYFATSWDYCNVIGIPSSPESGFTNSVNIIGGVDSLATYDIYDNVSGAKLIDDYKPMSSANPNYYTPYAQIGYSAGLLTIQSPRPVSSGSYAALIADNGTGIFYNSVGSYVGGSGGTPVNQYRSGGGAAPWVFSITAAGVVCFCKGTLIRDGQMQTIPIEQIQIGMVIATTKGNLPVKWVAKRRVKKSLSTEQFYKGALPVKIEANAFGKDIPSQDLYVSDRHGILADGNIVNASYLENGCNIYRVAESEFPDQIDYYHLEFEDEVLVYANDLQACSYVNEGTRRSFDNYAEFISLYVNVDSTVKSHVTAFKRTRPSLQGHKQRTKRSWQAA